MLENTVLKFPYDTGNIWEVDLEAFVSTTWSSFKFNNDSSSENGLCSKQLVYYADVLKGCLVDNSEVANEWCRTVDELFKVGSERGIDGFVDYGLKAINSAYVMSHIDRYITNFTNELFRHVCYSNTHIESIFEDYKELVKLSASSANIKFVVDIVDNFIRQFIEINKDEKTRLDRGLMPGDDQKLCVLYRVRVEFTKASFALLKTLLNSDDVKTDLNKFGVTLTLPNDTKTHKVFVNNFKNCFTNRYLRLYLENPESTQGVTKFIAYKAMNNDIVIKLL